MVKGKKKNEETCKTDNYKFRLRTKSQSKGSSQTKVGNIKKSKTDNIETKNTITNKNIPIEDFSNKISVTSPSKEIVKKANLKQDDKNKKKLPKTISLRPRTTPTRAKQLAAHLTLYSPDDCSQTSKRYEVSWNSHSPGFIGLKYGCRNMEEMMNMINKEHDPQILRYDPTTFALYSPVDESSPRQLIRTRKIDLRLNKSIELERKILFGSRFLRIDTGESNKRMRPSSTNDSSDSNTPMETTGNTDPVKQSVSSTEDLWTDDSDLDESLILRATQCALVSPSYSSSSPSTPSPSTSSACRPSRSNPISRQATSNRIIQNAASSSRRDSSPLRRPAPDSDKLSRSLMDEFNDTDDDDMLIAVGDEMPVSCSTASTSKQGSLEVVRSDAAGCSAPLSIGGLKDKKCDKEFDDGFSSGEDLIFNSDVLDAIDKATQKHEQAKAIEKLSQEQTQACKAKKEMIEKRRLQAVERRKRIRNSQNK